MTGGDVVSVSCKAGSMLTLRRRLGAGAAVRGQDHCTRCDTHATPPARCDHIFLALEEYKSNKLWFVAGIVTVSDFHVYVAPLKEEWRPLFWCCCYWCRVGRRRRPFDRKYDACLKGLLAIILIALLTLFLFGVVCAFATESQVESGAAELSQSLEAGINDTKEFLNATQAHARWLLVNNFDELKVKLNSMLYGIGVTASVKLGEFSRAVSVTTLNKMVQQLDEVQANLRTVHVKNQLLQTLAKCDQPKCRALQDKYKIGQLDTEIQYSQMPDVTELLGNVTALLDSDIKGDVAAGQQVFSDIQRGIQRSVDKHVPEVAEGIDALGRQLSAMTAELGEAIARKLEQYAARLEAGARRGVGRCGPLCNPVLGYHQDSWPGIKYPVPGSTESMRSSTAHRHVVELSALVVVSVVLFGFVAQPVTCPAYCRPATLVRLSNLSIGLPFCCS
ncbi:hypothetical protein HW555_005848 [Spodoptera exigua]|uniref:Uncharacterized protein n=1 Tax=Spodoptera exigua TaxID=7107 RepID=A0A835GG83_SPOEX|nr:hypothetical protein HW555_005848 [Spodoptera exigua]